jgi:dTDP-4-dehydrorhamnose reductase
MKDLILGAKGNLGQVFVDLYQDHEVLAWDRTELDIADEEAVKQRITEAAPELIINCAAYNAVDKAETEQELAETINGFAVGFVASVANSIGATLVQYSTGQVFDGSKTEGYNEDDMARPLNAYGKSKLIGEIEVQKNCENFYLIRTCWLYGKPAAGKKSFTDIVLDQAAAGTTINAVASEFGNPTYVNDLAHATRAIIEEKKPFGIYHLVNSGAASRYDWAKEVIEIKRLKNEVHAVDSDFFPRKARRPQYEVLNNTKFIELRPWTEALREYLTANS